MIRRRALSPLSAAFSASGGEGGRRPDEVARPSLNHQPSTHYDYYLF